MTTEIKVGDWVRFYRNGDLVIGVVEYIAKEDVLGHIELSTTAGPVDTDRVLEWRSK